MNDVLPFQFEAQEVRVILIGEEPWWVANDLAKVLGYKLAPHMTRMLDDDEKGIHIVDTLGGEQSLTIISESGMFAAVLKSRRDEAKRFRRWVTGEVLPALRRTGRYELPGVPPPAPAALTVTELDPARVMAAVTVVREARHIFGPESARSVWVKLGLPRPLGDATVTAVDDLAGALSQWMEGRDQTTAGEAARGIGFANPDLMVRRRVGDTLRKLGFVYQRCRREGRLEYFWLRPGTTSFVSESEG